MLKRYFFENEKKIIKSHYEFSKDWFNWKIDNFLK